MTVRPIDGRDTSPRDDPLRTELVELLEAAGAHHDEQGPRAHVWEQIEAAISERPRPSATPTPIATARRRRARRTIVRIAAIAAAVSSVGGLAYAGLASSGDEGAAPVPAAAPGADAVERAARDASEQADALLVTLTGGDGAAVVDVVALPDGTAYVLESRLPDADGRYLLYALVGEARVLLGTLRDAGSLRLDRIPAGAALLALVDDVGEIVAGASLVSDAPPVTPPALPGTGDPGRTANRRSVPDPETDPPPPPTGLPALPEAPAVPPPPPDDPAPLVEIDLPALLRDLIPG